MRDILVADFMPGGYTQMITAGLESVVAWSDKEENRPRSPADEIIREVALRSLCLVAAVFTTCLNLVMGLPYLTIALFKGIQNRHDAPDFSDGIFKVSCLAAIILLLGTVSPVFAAIVSPSDVYRRDEDTNRGLKSNPLDFMNIANLALFIHTLPELPKLLENSQGIEIDSSNPRYEQWREKVIQKSLESFGQMSFDEAYTARDGCDSEMIRAAGMRALSDAANRHAF